LVQDGLSELLSQSIDASTFRDTFWVYANLDLYLIYLDTLSHSACESDFCIAWKSILQQIHFHFVLMYNFQIPDHLELLALRDALDHLILLPIKIEDEEFTRSQVGNNIFSSCLNISPPIPVFESRFSEFKRKSEEFFNELSQNVEGIESSSHISATSYPELINYSIEDVSDNSLTILFKIGRSIYSRSRHLDSLTRTNSILLEAFNSLRKINDIKQSTLLIKTIHEASSKLRSLIVDTERFLDNHL
jgi:RNAse (barnase) inhibitor barstar